jgi:hypothetical protein
MRLFRRSVLCLVVGVTAFGVAGWMFRPRESWTVELANGDLMFGGGRFHFPSQGPIWIVYFRSTGEALADSELPTAEAYDAETGALLTRVELERAYKHGVNASSDLFTATFEPDHRNPKSTLFRRYRPDQPGLQRSFRLDGRWDLDRGGRRAVRIQKTPKSAAVSIADPATGRIIATRTFEGDLERFADDFTASDDGRWAAIGERLTYRSEKHRGVQVVDLETGAVAHRLLPPGEDQPPENGPFGEVDFSDDSLTLAFSLIPERDDATRSRWRFELETHRYDRLILRPITPPPFDTSDGELFNDRKYGNVWTALDKRNDSLWFSVERDGRTILPWRAFPFPTQESLVPSQGFREVPGRPELVSKLDEPSVSSPFARMVHRINPTWGAENESTLKFRWHDWERNVWRDVGCPDGVGESRVRSNALLTTSRSRGTNLLQSWPLPPRDPKWPALGIAAACMAGTWWACARSYRRRVNRNATAAVTA